MDYILQHSSFIFGGLLILIVVIMLALVFYAVLSSKNKNHNEHVEVIRYSQNGYHSSDTGYQTGKFTKNNTYNGR